MLGKDTVMKLLTATALVMMGLLGALAATPDETSREFKKQADAAIKAQDLPKAWAMYEKAWSAEGISASAVSRIMSDAKWAFTITTRNGEYGRKICEAIIASAAAPAANKFDAYMWIAQNLRFSKDWEGSRKACAASRALSGLNADQTAGAWSEEALAYVEEKGADAAKKALEAYANAFKVPGQAPRNLDARRLKAVLSLKKNYPEAGLEICDAMLRDDKLTDPYRYEAFLERARYWKKAGNEKNLYRDAEAAAAIKGNFDRRPAYYLLAEHEFDKGRYTRKEEPVHFQKYLALMDKAYNAAVKEMGLPREEAAEVYYKVSLNIIWHMGRPARDVKKAREYFEKAIALGAKDNASLKFRIEDQERREVQFAKFPNRDWRKEDGVMFGGIAKELDSGKVVRARDFGWTKDDATKALQGAIDSEASVIIVDKMECPWQVEQIVMRSNKKVVLEKGVVIEAKKGGFIKSGAMIHIAKDGSAGCSNVVIVGKGNNELRMRKADYMKNKALYPSHDDNRHGVDITGGSKNIWIRNLKIVSAGGDGICVAGGNKFWLDNVEITDAMRQALTLGTGSDVIYLTDCKFNDTWGMEPMSGIDIENWTENCSIAEIYCEGCEFANNRIYGLVLATSTYTPMTMLFKDCVFRDNGVSSLSILNRPGVPTVTREIFENCKFLQPKCVAPIQYIRTLIGNVTFRDCLIKETPGGNSSEKMSPISVALDPDMSEFFTGKNVFENLKIEGFEGVELLTMVPRANGSEYINPELFEGVIDFNGKKIDIRKYIIERGLNKTPPSYSAAELDLNKLAPPPLDTAVDAYIPAPFGSGTELIYWAQKDRVIKLGYFARVTGWTKWQKGRAITVQKADGSKEIVAGLDYTNDFTTAYYKVPADGFYRFTATNRGFWVPADDQAWGYCYRAESGDGFIDMRSNTFTGFFEVPKRVGEVTIQTRGHEGFELVDAGNNVLVKEGPSRELKTWTFRVKNPGVWRFRMLHGSMRFFAPLNGIFADQPANLPRSK